MATSCCRTSRLFGFLGLLLADSILATLKVTLQELSTGRAQDAGEQPQVVAAKAPA
jgi:predicted PurR-regulated permease PerM